MTPAERRALILEVAAFVSGCDSHVAATMLDHFLPGEGWRPATQDERDDAVTCVNAAGEVVRDVG